MKKIIFTLLLMVGVTIGAMAQNQAQLAIIKETAEQVTKEKKYTPQQRDKIVEILSNRTKESAALTKKKLPQEENQAEAKAINQKYAKQLDDLLGPKSSSYVLGKLKANREAAKK
ncbi:MAG: hypothetical protein SNG35_08840 [Rikenellaceae bacterium]